MVVAGERRAAKPFLAPAVTEMQRLVFIVIISLLGWYGYRHFQARTQALSQTTGPLEVRPQPQPAQATEPSPPATARANLSSPAPQYKCDGRIYCSQMTSCDEATYFLRNCPGVKMDGNNDGVPCEQQWCTR